ncbi:methyltransferase domain-containing protein [Nostoc edaphicum CCNP1411]|uniref:Methyltransferase domain-containing protein n=1 Tax=Nostoc edaphicum CCNP1411 TaxID=1472755 RepID=A0A7D7QAA2_9NOSO|nr:methyltransferase domain-containing protein [Nostoc edaphicum]QMS89555.1 methyltransferase domain-containing protein [Nostoc edaphicum CCNP1411]
MNTIVRKIYDTNLTDSWASKLRKKRFSLFTSILDSIPSPIKILDVGGTISFWKNLGFLNEEVKDVEITLLNVKFIETSLTHPKIKQVVGNATNMANFQSNEFDIVFSNSVIEHVGDYEQQRQMATEVMRVGKKYFVQTPNLFFPIEPHFVFPLFQFMPINIRVWLLTNFALGWYDKVSDKQLARSIATSIKLLNKSKFLNLFPEAQLYEEKFFGLTKSFTVYGESL